MGVLFAFFGVLCFSAFYLLVDHSQRRKADPMGLNLVTFCVGALASLAAAGGIHPDRFPASLLAIGSLIGVTAGRGLLGLTPATRGGMSISVVNTVW